MSCPRGDANPSQHTKLRLFAASGGFCQNPACERSLFLDAGGIRIHIAEIAHVFAAHDSGPRPNKELSESERGSFENLILLCSVCHTIIDKAEEAYPECVIKVWKRDHEQRLAATFGAVHFSSRAVVRAAIEGLLAENRMIFNQYNPDLDYRENPESEEADVWQKKVRERIIPNNRRILSTLDANPDHTTEEERETIEEFRQHVLDLESRHLTDTVAGAQRRFPQKMDVIMRSE